MPEAPRVGTLGDLARQRRQLWLTCVPCWRHSLVDLAAAIERHGDMGLQRFLERSRCTQCGGRDAEAVQIAHWWLLPIMHIRA
jgi:hypothetical protein